MRGGGAASLARLGRDACAGAGRSRQADRRRAPGEAATARAAGLLGNGYGTARKPLVMAIFSSGRGVMPAHRKAGRDEVRSLRQREASTAGAKLGQILADQGVLDFLPICSIDLNRVTAYDFRLLHDLLSLPILLFDIR